MTRRCWRSSIEGDTYEYADALEIETIGTLKASTLKRLRRDLPPDAARLNLQFWHLRDRSDTGFRCVVPNTSTQQLRLRDHLSGDRRSARRRLAGGDSCPFAEVARWPH